MGTRGRAKPDYTRVCLRKRADHPTIFKGSPEKTTSVRGKKRAGEKSSRQADPPFPQELVGGTRPEQINYRMKKVILQTCQGCCFRANSYWREKENSGIRKKVVQQALKTLSKKTEGVLDESFGQTSWPQEGERGCAEPLRGKDAGKLLSF